MALHYESNGDWKNVIQNNIKAGIPVTCHGKKGYF